MNSGPTVQMPQAVYKEIVQWAEGAFPYEGCGLLIGRFDLKVHKKVDRFVPLTNDLLLSTELSAPTLPKDRQGPGSGKTEFVMNAVEFNKEYMKALREGLDVVGVVHTHPNHPPRPSHIDSSQPFLAQWSNVIVSVINGKMADMKSWFRHSDDIPFVEEPIVVV